jgi:hypothetical protein
MGISITRQQRDALYDHILCHLSGIGDIELAVDQRDYETAKRLGMAFSDELRLVTEDLGWDESGPDTPIELKTPPDVLRRALSGMRDVVLRLHASEEEYRQELRENTECTDLIVEACQQVLADLDGRNESDD